MKAKKIIQRLNDLAESIECGNIEASEKDAKALREATEIVASYKEMKKELKAMKEDDLEDLNQSVSAILNETDDEKEFEDEEDFER